MQDEGAFASLYEECSMVKDRDFPVIVDVELTNFCNMKCEYCPTGQGTSTRPKGFMEANVWYAVLRELIEYDAAVRFVGWGEPTLHPMLYMWIKQAHRLDVKTHLTTNGTVVPVELWTKPLGTGDLDSYRISEHKHKDLSEPPKEYLPCPKVHSMLTVQWDGNVTACQGDYDGVMPLGNIKHVTLAELWKCPKMESYRCMLGDMRHADMQLCRNCAREEGK